MREGPWRRRMKSRNSEREPAVLGRACQAKRLGDRMAERGSPGGICGVAGPSRSKRRQKRFRGTPPTALQEPGISGSAKRRSTTFKLLSFARYHRISHPWSHPWSQHRSHPRSHPISHLLSYPRHGSHPTITLLVSPTRRHQPLHRLQLLQPLQLLQLPCPAPRLAARRHRTMDEVHGRGATSCCDPLLRSTAAITADRNPRGRRPTLPVSSERPAPLEPIPIQIRSSRTTPATSPGPSRGVDPILEGHATGQLRRSDPLPS
jgi:hypothetical protein